MVAASIDKMREQFADAPGEGEFGCKAGIVKAPTVDVENRIVKGVISTTTRDLDDEIVVAAGFDLSYFEQVKTVYFHHQYDTPIGRNVRLAMRDDGMYATTYISKTPFADDILTMISEEIINGFSVGFRAQDAGPLTDDEREKYGDASGIVRRSLLLEYSSTPMPACPDALVKSLDACLTAGKIHRSSAVKCGLPDSPRRKMYPVSGPATVERRMIVTDDGDVVVMR